MKKLQKNSQESHKGNTSLVDDSYSLPDILSKRPRTSKPSEILNKVGLIPKTIIGNARKRASTASTESQRNH